MKFTEIYSILAPLCLSTSAFSYTNGCGRLYLSSERWGKNFTFTPNSVYKIRCPLVDSQGYCGIVNMVEWFRSDTKSGDRVPVQTSYLIDPLTFYFNDPSEDDSGWYTCSVGNNVGISDISTYIHFKDFPPRDSSQKPSFTRGERIPILPSPAPMGNNIDDYLDDLHVRFQNTVRNSQNNAARSSDPPLESLTPQIPGFTNFDWGRGSASHQVRASRVQSSQQQQTSRQQYATRQDQTSYIEKQQPSRQQQASHQEDHLMTSASSNNIQTVQPSQLFDNKKWNTAYEDEDLSEHLNHIYEQMSTLESRIQSLQTQVDACNRACGGQSDRY
eukprot:TRINITY_DN1586_c0_g1_i2.p1 TRINITY_DN1586_c0_g1~~TRINITY_DN1586_c0_g1_i2.p1  ORF type:complete len:341 (-),score=29.84 TRINITY_DN1586_c0_g1_i2:707-1696(-)